MPRFAALMILAAPVCAQELDLGAALRDAEAKAPAGTTTWSLEDEQGKVQRVVRLAVQAKESGLSISLFERWPGARSGPYEVRTEVALDAKGRTTRIEQESKASDGTKSVREVSIGAEGSGAQGSLTTHKKGSKESQVAKFASKADGRGLPTSVVPLLLARLAPWLKREGAVLLVSDDCQTQRSGGWSVKGGVIGLDGKEAARVTDGKLVRLHGLIAKEIDDAAAQKLR